MRTCIAGLVLAASLPTCVEGQALTRAETPRDTITGRVMISLERDTLAVRVDDDTIGDARPVHLFFALFDGAVPPLLSRLQGWQGRAVLRWTRDSLVLVDLTSDARPLLALTTRADSARAYGVVGLIHHVGPGLATAASVGTPTAGVYQQDPPPDPGGNTCPGSCGCIVAAGNSCNVSCIAPRCASCLCLSELASCTCVLAH